jgi:hypothetical protein
VFFVTVTNTGQFKETVTSSMVSAKVTVNSVDKSSDITMAAKAPVVLGPGAHAKYSFTWNHGDTLHIGDAIVITGCVAYAGDSVPANNCSVVQQPAAPIDVSVPTVTLTKVTTSSVANTITATLRNSGTQQVSPLRPNQVVASVKVGNAAPVTLLTPGGEKILIAGGAAHYKWNWSHGSVPLGTTVTVTVTVNITGNTSASTTGTASRTSVVK